MEQFMECKNKIQEIEKRIFELTEEVKSFGIFNQELYNLRLELKQLKENCACCSNNNNCICYDVLGDNNE